MLWNSFISKQPNNGVYSTELFIKTTVVFIGVNVIIMLHHM